MDLEEKRRRFLKLCQDPNRWSWVFDTPAGERCGTGVAVLQHRKTGQIVAVPAFCQRWSCERCGPYRALRHFTHLAECFEAAGRISFAKWRLEGDLRSAREALRERLRQRRKEKGGELASVVREDGWSFVFATRALAGREHPRLFSVLTAEEAADALMSALEVPGLGPWAVSYSSGWRLREFSPGERRYKLLGHADRAAFEAVMAEFGAVRGQPPDGMSAEEFARQVEERLFKKSHEFYWKPFANITNFT